MLVASLVDEITVDLVAHLEPWWDPSSGTFAPFHEPSSLAGGSKPPVDPRHTLLNLVWTAAILIRIFQQNATTSSGIQHMTGGGCLTNWVYRDENPY